MKFKETHDDGSTITYSIPQESDLDQVLEAFTDFLRGVGYIIPHSSYLAIVNEEDDVKIEVNNDFNIEGDFYMNALNEMLHE